MLGTLELELQGAGSYLIDVDSELWSSETAASALDCTAICPALPVFS